MWESSDSAVASGETVSMPLSPMSESEYVDLLNVVSTEIENAFIIYHTYEALNQLALHDAPIFAVLNEDALFWQTYRSTLLTSLFMTMSRIFDPTGGTITAQTVVAATIGNLHLFSKQALRTRRTKPGPKPDWFDEFIDSVWEPASPADLKHLKKALNPHLALFQSVYLPIRHNIYAHRLMSDDQAGVELFPKTNREELKGTPHFLRDLDNIIRDLYNNGRKPILGQHDSTAGVTATASRVEKVLRKLAAR